VGWRYLTDHWSFDPSVYGVAFVVALHEIGLHRLARRSTPARIRRRRWRSAFFYSGLGVLVLSVVSPIDYWADMYFYIHMLQHLLLMFAVPSLIVAGAPWLPLVHGVPVGPRRSIGRYVMLSPRAGWMRALGRVVLHPLTAVVSFNAVMILWHLPALYDLAYRNQDVHVWLMHASFVMAGVLFWLLFIPSYPLRPRLNGMQQAEVLLATNGVMIILAMAMSIFSNHSWYPVYDGLPGVSLSPFADQQIGASILWVCGDFWAVPALWIAIARFVREEGGATEALERLLRKPVLTVDDLTRARESQAPLSRAPSGRPPVMRPPTERDGQ
jgi:cytochrome c oxidase assembly factor CtaG